jgi:hypothetical protein
VFDTSTAANTAAVAVNTAAVAANTAAVTALQTRTERTDVMLGTSCPGDPSRTLLTANRDVNGLLLLLGYASVSLCRTLDADEAACNRSFESSTYGAAACAYIDGKCLMCDLPLDAVAACRNTCAPALTCADGSRQSRLGSCDQATTQPDCESAFTFSIEYATPSDMIRGASCYWSSGACYRCTPQDVATGKCTNTCLAATDLPVCRATGRAFGKCDALNADTAACNATFELGRYGTQTCWYGAGTCNGCDPIAEKQGKCTNGC